MWGLKNRMVFDSQKFWHEPNQGEEVGENKIAMRWITSYWLSTRIELILKNNES